MAAPGPPREPVPGAGRRGEPRGRCPPAGAAHGRQRRGCGRSCPFSTAPARAASLPRSVLNEFAVHREGVTEAGQGRRARSKRTLKPAWPACAAVSGLGGDTPERRLVRPCLPNARSAPARLGAWHQARAHRGTPSPGVAGGGHGAGGGFLAGAPSLLPGRGGPQRRRGRGRPGSRWAAAVARRGGSQPESRMQMSATSPARSGEVSRRQLGCHGDARRPCLRAAPGETPRGAGTRVTAEPRAGRARAAGEAAAGHASARARC